jgi:hypothetical protein
MPHRPNLPEANRLVQQEATSRETDGRPPLDEGGVAGVVGVRAAYRAEAAWRDAERRREQVVKALDDLMSPGRTIDRHTRDEGADIDIGWHVSEGYAPYPRDDHDRYRNGYGGSAEAVADLHTLWLVGKLGGVTLRRAAQRNLEASEATTGTDQGPSADEILSEALSHDGLFDDLVEYERETAIATALLAPRPESDADTGPVEITFAGAQAIPDDALAEKFWPAEAESGTWTERPLPRPSWEEGGVLPVAVNVRVTE